MNPTNHKFNYLKLLQIIHFALVAGVIVFALISFTVHISQPNPYIEKEMRDIFIYLIPVFVFGGFLASNIVFKTKILEIKPLEDIMKKLECYRSVLIVRYAFLEASALMAVIAHLLTADYLFLGITSITILYFIYVRPTREKVIYDLELDTNSF